MMLEISNTLASFSPLFSIIIVTKNGTICIIYKFCIIYKSYGYIRNMIYTIMYMLCNIHIIYNIYIFIT